MKPLPTAADLALPAGRTCSDCVNCKRCCGMFGSKPENKMCDFYPPRFQLRRLTKEDLDNAFDAFKADRQEVARMMAELQSGVPVDRALLDMAVQLLAKAQTSTSHLDEIVQSFTQKATE